MPLYEFRCRQCGERFEKLVRSSSEPEYPKCPQCGTRAVERLRTRFGNNGTSQPEKELYEGSLAAAAGTSSCNSVGIIAASSACWHAGGHSI